MSDPAIGYRFVVTVEGHPLGVFTKMEGLGAKYEVLSVKEGGENGYVHALPGRLSFDNLKLTRPVDGSSGVIAAWFCECRSIMQTGGRLDRDVTGSVSAYGPDDEVVARWDLDGIQPVSYSGPSFQAGSSNVLTETLELAHRGFTFAGGSPAPSAGSNGAGAQAMGGAGPALGAGATF
jgi:phage tail-like protein